MKRLAFLSALTLLAACTNTEGNIESAKTKIEKARLIVNRNPLDGGVTELLRGADDIIKKLEAEPLYSTGERVCRQLQLPFDAENLNLKVNTLRYEIDFAEAEKNFSQKSSLNASNIDDKNNFNYLYNVYKKHENDIARMTSGEAIAKECQKIGMNVVYKDEYFASIKSHEEVSRKIAAQYEKKAGVKFSDVVAMQEHYQSESRRKQTWDAMSPVEKDEAASGRKEVRKCLDAALVNNKSATKIPNVVSDVSTLCRESF